MGQKYILQQDSDPERKAKATMKWLARSKVGVLEWHSQSPDQITIEIEFSLKTN